MDAGHVVVNGEAWDLESNLPKLLEIGQDQARPISSLQLIDVELDISMAANVSQAFRQHKDTLQQLAVLECTGSIDVVVTVALSVLTNLKSLRISIGRLSTNAFNPCANSLGVGLYLHTSLRKLVLQSGSSIFFTLSRDAAASLEHGLSRQSPLDTLHIQGCRFGEVGAVHALARGLRGSQGLREVKLRNCFQSSGHSLGDTYLAELLRAMESNVGLTSLDVSGNKCLVRGIGAVATLLDRTSLQNLNLSCQCIETEGEFMDLSLLVAALGRTNSLRTIELRFNKLGDKNMAYLATALKHNSSIKYVGLSSNKITNTGLSILASRVQEMRCLQRLVLTNNCFDQDGAMELARAMESNYALQRVDLDPTIASSKMVRYFADLNWGGRSCLTGKDSSKVPSPALWAQLLERTNKLSTSEQGKERQVEVLFFALRHGPVLFPL